MEKETAADSCPGNSLTLHHGLLLLLLRSFCRCGWQQLPALYFRLIYDLCRGGCITKISHLGHAAAAMRRQKERAQTCTEASAGDLIKAERALQSEEPLSITVRALGSAIHLFVGALCFDIPPGRSSGLPASLKRQVLMLRNVLPGDAALAPRICVEELIKPQVQTPAPLMTTTPAEDGISDGSVGRKRKERTRAAI